MGATWYASPSSTGGDGSIGNPWTIGVAFTTNAIHFGDTVYLRGGTYPISQLFCYFSGVTFRSYPGEWAVIKSGLAGTLLTAMNNVTDPSTVQLQGSENWVPGMFVSLDNEQIRLDNTTGNPTNWVVERAMNGTVKASHSINTPAYVAAGMAIDHTGTNIVFRELEITSFQTTNRTGTLAFMPGGGINFHGENPSLLNCIIHDVAHPAIGLWDCTGGAEINGNILWGNGLFDTTFGVNGGDRGAGLYAQNSIGVALIKNNISFRNYTYGLKGYGETGNVSKFRFLQNICFQAGPDGWPLEVASGSTPMTNNVMWTNYVMGGGHTEAIHMSYQSFTNRGCEQIGNIVVNAGLIMRDHLTGTCSNNLCLIPASFTVSDNTTITFTVINTAFKTNLDFGWDFNTYYFANASRPHQFSYRTKLNNEIASDGSGSLLYANDVGKSWQEYSGFDVHSTYATSWPASYLNVKCFPLDYNPLRTYIVVVSTSGATSTTVDLSTNNFKIGDGYALRDAQNYFTAITSGTYSGSALTLPLNLTAIAPLQGSITNFVPQHTDVANPGLFNAFVLDRIPMTTFVFGKSVIGKAFTGP
jgi:hypothetical protein